MINVRVLNGKALVDIIKDLLDTLEFFEIAGPGHRVVWPRDIYR